MRHLYAVGTALTASLLIDGAAIAQTAPISSREVIGEWSLRMTPLSADGRTVTFKSRDGGPLIQPLSITTRSGDRLACTVDAQPAQCRIRDSKLVVTTGANGMRMTFTLTDRTRQGFAGTVDLRVRLLPIGGPIGTVDMVRR
jgi:hypothetical protein